MLYKVMIKKVIIMTRQTQERLHFLESLHQTFFKRKGHGAYAFISVGEAMNLFDKYLESNEQAEQFIDHYVRSC